MTAFGGVGAGGLSHSGDLAKSITPGRGTAPTVTTPDGGITPGCALASSAGAGGAGDVVGAAAGPGATAVAVREAAGAPGAVASHTHNGVTRSCTRALHV